MAEEPDFEKSQKEFLDNLKKMMAEMRPSPVPEPDAVDGEKGEKAKNQREKRLRFDLKPKEVKKYLDRYIIKQEDAKRVLATAVCDHYHHVKRALSGEPQKNYLKQNVIVLGPTGVGKSYMIRCLADLIGVPFVRADATKFSETGYVGGDVEDLVRELVQKADGDTELAECGIIYLDEVDKIASAVNLQGRDVSGSGVQRGLLKIMEETEVPLRNPQDLQSQMQAVMEFQKKGKMTRPVINTRHILFIVSGAFDGLAAIIEKRRKTSCAGFSVGRLPEIAREELFREARTEDFIEYGFEPEFVGRLPVRVVCSPLDAEDLYTVLKVSEGSILRQYEGSFEAYGIKARFRDEALWQIAKQAALEGTGARGLVTVCEKVFRDLKYELPSSAVREFTLTPEMVLSPAAGLESLLSEERHRRRSAILGEIKKYEENFYAKHNLRIEFEQAAAELAAQKVIQEDGELFAYLDKLLSNYAYGLGLIQNHKPREKFVLDARLVNNPNGVLERWIKEAYEKE